MTQTFLDSAEPAVHPQISTSSGGAEPDRFDSWAIVELFGHKKIAGRVTEQVIGGGAFVRVDVPASKHFAAYTKLLGNGAIYAITPVDEAIARKALEYINADPIPVYIPPDRQIGAGDQHTATAAVATDGRESEATACLRCGAPTEWGDLCEGCDADEDDDNDLDDLDEER